MTPFWREKPGGKIPFTDDVRICLNDARHEAARLGHEYVGAEHLLLALIGDTMPSAALLKRMGIDPVSIRSQFLAIIKPGWTAQSGPDLPYTSRGKRVLEESAAEAHERGDADISTVHLLLGLLRERDNIAAQVLSSVGVTAERVRLEANA
jgi:ATP-dependent Clp protease ATP-binding subunit ClpC